MYALTRDAAILSNRFEKKYRLLYEAIIRDKNGKARFQDLTCFSSLSVRLWSDHNSRESSQAVTEAVNSTRDVLNCIMRKVELKVVFDTI